MSKKIVVAISASTAESVLAGAVTASRESGASILLLHVVDALGCVLAAADFDCGPIIDAVQAQGQEIVSAASAWFVARGYPVETSVRHLPMHGVTVGQAIATVANEVHADLLLLGHRRKDWWQWVREDIAAEAAPHTNTPVHRVPLGIEERLPKRGPLQGARFDVPDGTRPW
jgi:nucleotide-binding universal stress UspA family protein